MSKRELPTSEELHKLLWYRPETGFLYWRPRPREMFKREMDWKTWNTRFANKRALSTIDSYGYCVGPIHYKNYRSHRVIWCMMTGQWPNIIDHENGNRSDNQWNNLKNGTQAQNGKNCKKSKRNSSGHTGIRWLCKYKRWHAQIYINGKTKSLGFHTTFEGAIAARKDAERKYGFHPNHGR